MRRQFTLVLAAAALSTVAFAQDGFYQIGYAANLNSGDSVLNLSNDGFQGGFINAVPFKTEGNICVNVYTFDPSEEEIACCACLVTPNGLNSLSAVSDLTSNPLTPAIPTSIVIKLVSSEPGFDPTGAFTICNASVVGGGTAANPYYPAPLPAVDTNVGFIVPAGMLAWGTTLEPAQTPATFSPVSVKYLNGTLSPSELTALTSTCGFIQGDATGFGICKSCRLGALAGSKK
jgi:hypothetical protein